MIKESKAERGNEMASKYVVRFIKAFDAEELLLFFHVAKVALSKGQQPVRRYHRMLWASDEFSKAHPEVKTLGAYKDLEGLLA